MSGRPRHAGCAVALVGPDGAGKTTHARALCTSLPRVKYLYMGTATGSANYTLPSSRLIHCVKRVRDRRSGRVGDGPAALLPAGKTRGAAATVAVGALRLLALVNRLAEEWYRQCVLWTFKARGFVVVCDRHFRFEHLPNSRSFHTGAKTMADRMHLWCLRNWYPKPDLVFFLDAAPEVLLARKGEWSLEHLARHRRAIEEEGQVYRHFVKIDATAAPDAILATLQEQVLRETLPVAPATLHPAPEPDPGELGAPPSSNPSAGGCGKGRGSHPC